MRGAPAPTPSPRPRSRLQRPPGRPTSALRISTLRLTQPQPYPLPNPNPNANPLRAACEQATGGHSRTFGALDPVQVTLMAPHLTSIYVSGWQSSSTASTSNEPGPDFADYPMDTVPNKVDQLFRALQFHERKAWEAAVRSGTENDERPDVLTPIVADGDTPPNPHSDPNPDPDPDPDPDLALTRP